MSILQNSKKLFNKRLATNRGRYLSTPNIDIKEDWDTGLNLPNHIGIPISALQDFATTYGYDISCLTDDGDIVKKENLIHAYLTFFEYSKGIQPRRFDYFIPFGGNYIHVDNIDWQPNSNYSDLNSYQTVELDLDESYKSRSVYDEYYTVKTGWRPLTALIKHDLNNSGIPHACILYDDTPWGYHLPGSKEDFPLLCSVNLPGDEETFTKDTSARYLPQYKCYEYCMYVGNKYNQLSWNISRITPYLCNISLLKQWAEELINDSNLNSCSYETVELDLDESWSRLNEYDQYFTCKDGWKPITNSNIEEILQKNSIPHAFILYSPDSYYTLPGAQGYKIICSVSLPGDEESFPQYTIAQFLPEEHCYELYGYYPRLDLPWKISRTVRCVEDIPLLKQWAEDFIYDNAIYDDIELDLDE